MSIELPGFGKNLRKVETDARCLLIGSGWPCIRVLSISSRKHDNSRILKHLHKQACHPSHSAELDDSVILLQCVSVSVLEICRHQMQRSCPLAFVLMGRNSGTSACLRFICLSWVVCTVPLSVNTAVHTGLGSEGFSNSGDTRVHAEQSCRSHPETCSAVVPTSGLWVRVLLLLLLQLPGLHGSPQVPLSQEGPPPLVSLVETRTVIYVILVFSVK